MHVGLRDICHILEANFIDFGVHDAPGYPLGIKRVLHYQWHVETLLDIVLMDELVQASRLEAFAVGVGAICELRLIAFDDDAVKHLTVFRVLRE